MVKLKLNEVRMLIEPLKKISVQEFPVKYSWKIMNLCETVEGIVNKIENFRVQLVNKYGDDVIVCRSVETDEERIFPQNTEIDETKWSIVSTRKEVRDTNKLQQFYVEYNELLAEEVDVVPEKIDLSEITDKISASAQELSILKSIFIFE